MYGAVLCLYICVCIMMYADTTRYCTVSIERDEFYQSHFIGGPVIMNHRRVFIPSNLSCSSRRRTYLFSLWGENMKNRDLNEKLT